MGFTTGFVGGVTLTYSVLYLTLHMHRENRIHQASLLSQQRSLLTHLYDPPSEIYDSPAYEVRQAGLAEQLKDRWNRELSGVMRNLQENDWEATRLRWERRVGNVWRSVGGDVAVQDARDKVIEAGETARSKAVEVGESARSKAVEVGESARIKAVEVGESARHKAVDVGESARIKAVEVGESARHKAVEVKDNTRRKVAEASSTARNKAVEVKDNVVAAGKDARDKLKTVGQEVKRDTKEIAGQKRLLEL